MRQTDSKPIEYILFQRLSLIALYKSPETIEYLYCAKTPHKSDTGNDAFLMIVFPKIKLYNPL